MRQFSRYLVVGVLNTVWSYLIIFASMYLLRWSPEASNVGGYAIGLLTSYALNRTYTFNSRGAKGPEFARFIGIFAIAFCANFVALMLLLRVLGVNAILGQLWAGVVYVGTSYVLNRSYVFRRGSS
jgi:putative flippase GtrA